MSGIGACVFTCAKGEVWGGMWNCQRVARVSGSRGWAARETVAVGGKEEDEEHKVSQIKKKKVHLLRRGEEIFRVLVLVIA